MVQPLLRRALDWLTPERCWNHPTLIAGMLLAGWLVTVLVGPGLTDITGTVVGVDFLAFYTGGRFLVEGRLPEVYDFAAQTAFQWDVMAPAQTQHVQRYLNPPSAAVLYAPFAVGPYLVGLLAWWGLGFAALGASIRGLRAALPPLQAVPLRRLARAALIFYPTLLWIITGQASALALGIWTLTFILLRRGRDAQAGLALSLLVFKPQLALGWVVVLLAARRWRAIAGGAAGLAAWLGFTQVLSPDAFPAWWAFRDVLFDFVRYQNLSSFSLYSLYEFALLALDGVAPGLAGPLGWALTVTGMAGLALAWWRAPWTPGARAWDLRLAASLAMGLLVSVHLFAYDLMLMLLPLAVVWSHHVEGRGGRALDGGPLLLWSAAIYVSALFSGPFTQLQFEASTALLDHRIGVQLGVLALLGWARAAWATAEAQDPGGGSARSP
ncbi:MAG: DUF2029 domain-containing protein [Alphaproteobacteria bacterium]|nr:DUF2029 domain-containing protein [Alphaproteobacteria bacterium]